MILDRLLKSVLAFALCCSLVAPAFAANPVVEMRTTLGDVHIELNPDKAPKTVENFLQYVNDRFYDGTIFHRVIPGFMVQGGGFTSDMTQKPTRAPIQNEARNGLRNDTGTIAMARTNDPNSATAQFFINVVDNRMLDPNPQSIGYAVFGKVVKGMDVVNKIVAVPTGRRMQHSDVPVKPVVIQSIRLVQPK